LHGTEPRACPPLSPPDLTSGCTDRCVVDK
jgi:hypothetical protein